MAALCSLSVTLKCPMKREELPPRSAGITFVQTANSTLRLVRAWKSQEGLPETVCVGGVREDQSLRWPVPMEMRMRTKEGEERTRGSGGVTEPWAIARKRTRVAHTGGASNPTGKLGKLPR